LPRAVKQKKSLGKLTFLGFFDFWGFFREIVFLGLPGKILTKSLDIATYLFVFVFHVCGF